MSLITPQMRAIVGRVMRETVSFPVTDSDIRRWAVAVYWPEPPPRRFWDEASAPDGLVAPEEFNPFAWIARRPSPEDPPVSQTAFSERELGVEPPPYRAIVLSEIRTRYGGARIRPGDVIRSTHAITDYMEREGRMGLMLYTTLAHTLHNQSGEWLRTVESVFVRY